MDYAKDQRRILNTAGEGRWHIRSLSPHTPFTHMPNFNKIFLIGNLTHDPELKKTPEGVAVATFSVATNHTYRKADETTTERVCFVDVVVWDTLAKQCAKSLKKGQSVFVEGRLEYHTWEDDEGQKRYKHEVYAQTVQFLSPKENKSP